MRLPVTREQIYADRHLCGLVKRYHTWPMLREQTVAEHCWRVACIYVEIFGMPRAEVLYYCLHHDSGEQWAGDVPYGVKRSSPTLTVAMHEAETSGLRMLSLKLPELEPAEQVKVKICDLLEMWETGEHELRLGNSYAEPIARDTLAAAQSLAGEHCLSVSVNNWLTRWRSA